MKLYLSTIALFVILCIDNASAQSSIKLAEIQEGDLIFQSIPCGDLCEAIEAVTPGYKDQKFSHIGLVVIKNNTPFIIEAIGTKVKYTALSDFLNRSTKTHYLGRIKNTYQHVVAKSVDFSKKQIGKPYDTAFLMNNDAYYCSELIYDAFKFAFNNEEFFFTSPMTYKSNNGAFNPVWKQYFEKKNIRIPESELGINPGSISRSNKLEIYLLVNN
jgi:hypothetical protein